MAASNSSHSRIFASMTTKDAALLAISTCLMLQETPIDYKINHQPLPKVVRYPIHFLTVISVIACMSGEISSRTIVFLFHVTNLCGISSGVTEKGLPCDNIAQCLCEKGNCFKMKTHAIIVSSDDMLAYGPNANDCVWQSQNAKARKKPVTFWDIM